MSQHRGVSRHGKHRLLPQTGQGTRWVGGLGSKAGLQSVPFRLQESEELAAGWLERRRGVGRRNPGGHIAQ